MCKEKDDGCEGIEASMACLHGAATGAAIFVRTNAIVRVAQDSNGGSCIVLEGCEEFTVLECQKEVIAEIARFRRMNLPRSRGGDL